MAETKQALDELCAETTPRDRRNLRRVLWTLFGWALLFVSASQGFKRDLIPPGPLAWTVAILAAGAGIFVLLAFGRFLREADELQRLIQLEALAVGFGGTFFAIAGLRVFERAGAPPASLGDVTLTMSLLYAIGLVIAGRRYR